MSKKTAKPAEYVLEESEKEHLRAIRGMFQYLQQVVQADMARYVDVVVKPRLKIADELQVTVDLDKGTFTAEPHAEDKTATK